MSEASRKTKVLVIGSGFGGLAAAIRLQTQGFAVEILEKRDQPGGRAYVFRDKGFIFDAGPTVITAPDCLRELFELSGRRMEDYVELVPVTPMYRLCWEDGDTFDYTDDLEATLAQISQRSPVDRQGYLRFLEYSKAVFVEGYEKLAHVPFLTWGSMLRVAPQLLSLKAYRTVYQTVSAYIQDEHLRQAFSFHSLLVGGNPFQASSIYTLIHYLERKWGVYFAKGGTGALVQGLVKLFQDQGGVIRYQSEVKQVLVEEGKVRGVVTAAEEMIPADLVVSNADVARTYLDLLGGVKTLAPQQRKMRRSRYSMSLFLIYFGTNKKYENVAHHSVLFGRRYKELLDDIFGKGKLADDFSLYLHRPTATDPNLAPPGGDSFYVLSPVPHLGNWQGEWDTEKHRYGEKILHYLEEHYLPNLREHLVTTRYFTPGDFATELNAHLGSAFSLEPLLTQSAYFRAHNRDSRVEGLYIVGAGTHPGAGVPGVVGSARATTSVILQDYLPHAGSTTAELEYKCRQTIRVGSKSFAFASLLFGAEARRAASFLYAWCRHCDDSVDQALALSEKQVALAELRLKTDLVLQGGVPETAPFQGLAQVVRRNGIPRHYCDELLNGMEMDLHKSRYENEAELTQYCYRVAGVVGLMMSHVMGVSDAAALPHAAALGNAMQMTNIARDILDDAAMGRVYLPVDWLADEGLTPETVSLPESRPALVRVVNRLLDVADRNYILGEAGLRYLPWRCALAVAVASQVYRQIGQRVRRSGVAAWDRRAVVPMGEKFLALLGGLFRCIRTRPYRLKRFQAVSLERPFVWQEEK